jgi:hypothetical protein
VLVAVAVTLAFVAGPITSKTSCPLPWFGPCGRRGSGVAPGGVPLCEMMAGNGPWLPVGVKMPMFNSSFLSGPNVKCTSRYFTFPSGTNSDLISRPCTFPGGGGIWPMA